MTSPFDFAQSEHDKPSRNWHNNCGVFTRSAFGAASVGDFDGDGAADAEDQWKSAKFKHPETDPTKIPRGVPVFWTGGTGDNGHAAVSRGDGTIWTTDLVRDGQVDVAPTADVTRKWGLTLLGWTEDIGGVRVWTPPAPEPVKVPVEPAVVADFVVGDWNLKALDVAAIARNVGGTLVRGEGVDHAIIRGGTSVKTDVLTKGGSDHPPIVYTLDVVGHPVVALSWNVYVGQRVGRVKRRMRRLIERHAPDVIALQEAYRCGPMLTKLAAKNGYTLIQGENVGEGADCALLMREPRRTGFAQMQRAWVGPKHNLRKWPRRYPRARTQLAPRVSLRVMVVHPPTGGTEGRNADAVNESIGRITNWIQKGSHS